MLQPPPWNAHASHFCPCASGTPHRASAIQDLGKGGLGKTAFSTKGFSPALFAERGSPLGRGKPLFRLPRGVSPEPPSPESARVASAAPPACLGFSGLRLRLSAPLAGNIGFTERGSGGRTAFSPKGFSPGGLCRGNPSFDCQEGFPPYPLPQKALGLLPPARHLAFAFRLCASGSPHRWLAKEHLRGRGLGEPRFLPKGGFPQPLFPQRGSPPVVLSRTRRAWSGVVRPGCVQRAAR